MYINPKFTNVKKIKNNNKLFTNENKIIAGYNKHVFFKTQTQMNFGKEKVRELELFNDVPKPKMEGQHT